LVEGEYHDKQLELEYSKNKIEIESEAVQIANDLRQNIGIVEDVNKRKNTHNPPAPFNLSGLQSEAYRHFGYKPSRTLAIAQKLYLEALISYPRTNSQQIPESIDTREILKNLGKNRAYKKLVDELLIKKKLTPVQGKKRDPAHPAIHPTGNKPEKITPSEKKLYDLIVKRFLALFAEPSIKESIRADIKCGAHSLYLRGLRILESGWIRFYDPYSKSDEREIPSLEKGSQIKITNVECEARYTKPPAFYNPSSLLKALEKVDLGTKATRAGIVDSLRSRGYTLNDRFELSTLGYTTFETLEQYMPVMLSSEFTRQLEDEMESIQMGEQTRKAALSQAKGDLLELLEKFQEQEEEIGNALVSGLQRFWKEKQELGPCPKCDDGRLIIIRSPKTGKRFVGCSNYKEKSCDQTFPLPQKGEITPLDKLCEHCGYQMFGVKSRRRKWETCVNWTECPGRSEEIQALEEQRKKRAEKEANK
jgi:DNA topoisomerase-1